MSNLGLGLVCNHGISRITYSNLSHCKKKHQQTTPAGCYITIVTIWLYVVHYMPLAYTLQKAHSPDQHLVSSIGLHITESTQSWSTSGLIQLTPDPHTDKKNSVHVSGLNFHTAHYSESGSCVADTALLWGARLWKAQHTADTAGMSMQSAMEATHEKCPPGVKGHLLNFLEFDSGEWNRIACVCALVCACVCVRVCVCVCMNSWASVWFEMCWGERWGFTCHWAIACLSLLLGGMWPKYKCNTFKRLPWAKLNWAKLKG